MVGNDPVMVVLDRINREMSQFLWTDDTGETVYDPFALAVLVTEIVTEHTTALQTERDEIARESDLREQEVIALTVERDRLEDRLADIAQLLAGGAVR